MNLSFGKRENDKERRRHGCRTDGGRIGESKGETRTRAKIEAKGGGKGEWGGERRRKSVGNERRNGNVNVSQPCPYGGAKLPFLGYHRVALWSVRVQGAP